MIMTMILVVDMMIVNSDHHADDLSLFLTLQ